MNTYAVSAQHSWSWTILPRLYQYETYW